MSDIGDGRNLLWNSNFAKTDEAITGTTNSWGLHTRGTNLVASIDTSTKHNGFNTLKTVSAANGDKNSSNDLEWFAWGISERTSDNLHSKIKIIHYHFTQRRVLRLILLLDGDMMPMVRILQEHLQQIGKSMKSNYIKQQVHIV